MSGAEKNATPLAWGLAAAAAALNVLAYALSLYELAWFDEALHAFTLFALTFIVACLLRRDLAAARMLPYCAILVACGLALGTLWEFAEWGYDMFSRGNSILGKQDTMVDLVLDTVGAVLAALLALARARQARTWSTRHRPHTRHAKALR